MVQLPTNLYELNAFQLMQFISSDDVDASEFGSRFARYLALLAIPQRGNEEQIRMEALLKMLERDYSKAEFREQLEETLQPREAA